MINATREVLMRIPEGFGTVTPYFFVEKPYRFIEFLMQGLGGILMQEHKRPDGGLANAQVRLGTSTVMVSEATQQYPPMAAAYYLYVENADLAVRQALACGATLTMKVADMPYGDRQGGVRDPHGNVWWISQRLVSTPYA
jgi:PhnB protein